MLKNFKGLVTRTCLEEFAHRFLIAVFDTIDDTVLIDRCILKVTCFYFVFLVFFCILVVFKKSERGEKKGIINPKRSLTANRRKAETES